MPKSPEQPELFVALVESAPDAVLVVNGRGVLVHVNDQAEQLFGYSADKLLGESIELLVPETVRAAHVAMRDSYTQEPRRRPMGTGRDLRARRADGTTFPVDVSLSPVDTSEGRLFTAFVRDATEQRRRQRQAEAVAEVTAALLESRDMPDVLALAARHMRAVMAADVAWVVTPDGDSLVVRAAAGHGAAEFLGVRTSVRTAMAGIAMNEGEPMVITSLADEPRVVDRARVAGFGPTVIIPLVSGEHRFGALVASRGRGKPAFSDDDVDNARLFAGSASVALAFGEARAELERQHLAAEQERIGRELLNRVIHEVYGIGLLLQSSIAFANHDTSVRLEEAVGRLDEVIRQIRDVVFGMVGDQEPG